MNLHVYTTGDIVSEFYNVTPCWEVHGMALMRHGKLVAWFRYRILDHIEVMKPNEVTP